jgi:regulator of protease activity HflC (stomatin/prohibitin superfamily)
VPFTTFATAEKVISICYHILQGGAMTENVPVDTQPVAPVGHSGAGVEVRERPATNAGGLLGVGVILVCVVLAIVLGLTPLPGLLTIPVVIAALVLTSLVVVSPGESRVVQFFGRYIGTVRRPGLAWVAPLSTRRSVSVRVRNFETNLLKVNDSDGNPVEIAAIVVWQVADTARAVFSVDDYPNFVRVQAESALRHVTNSYPYDNGDDVGTSLRGATDEVAVELANEVAARVLLAGVEIVEVRISHLAYASEIAQAMLRRQQANAVVAARARIVEGAVGMVEMALNRLSEGDVVELDEERKAAMVSNLMVVLCGDQPAAPIVNAGTLYN